MFSVLAVEIDGMTLRAAVIRRNLKGFMVGDCLKIDRTEESELITAEELSMITSRIARCPKNVVVVSPLAAVIEVAMDKKRLRKMRPYQLKEALRWEAEPYMTVPAAESLVGYELGLETGDGHVWIWVSTLPEEDYRSLKETFAGGGLKLRRVYPPDVCFPVAAMLACKRKDKVVIDLGQQTMRAALIEDGDITAFRTLPADLAATRAHLDGLSSSELEPSLKEVFNAWEIAGRRVILTGPGGLDADIVEFFREKMGFEAAALELRGSGNCTPEFAAVAGAGMRQLHFGVSWKKVGINDDVELGLLIRQRVQVLPMVAVLVIVAIFLSHYFYLKYQLRQFSMEAGDLKVQKEEGTRLQNSSSEMEKQRSALKQKAEFIQGHALDKEKVFQLLLSVTVRCSGLGELSRMNVQYLPDDLVLLQGEALSPANVNELALTLQKEVWCKHAAIESIGRVEKTEKIVLNKMDAPEELELKETVYNFTIKVSVDPEAELSVPSS
ncbi:Fimbrial assembly family protein [Desulfofarcimen acetoxidans DSM 771]|uniref:Fimbrial assembly family protein n=1 Tax=Desulfofarcimen acetoxidans (strain ATCC 49208 / DSM 771 / KCTC 5769 / VKM B-1644 / 5575) TaxID=485916 RepID=C8W154_DESAS|nr:hypothetical protein [Desulfofarcimen acetoxidans]ACV63450.1 Fimbrial assembly family protein [Desulfofarcimen acetoxidans DSM 771]